MQCCSFTQRTRLHCYSIKCKKKTLFEENIIYWNTVFPGILYCSLPRVWNRYCLSVCPSVCLSFSTLTGEAFNVWTKDLVVRQTLIKSWMSLKVKVIGQRSILSGWKTWFFSDFQMGWPVQFHFVMSYNVMWHHGGTSWRRVMSQRGVIMSLILTSLGKNTDKKGTTREGHQRSGVFIHYCSLIK